MEYFENDNLDDNNKNDFNYENKTGLYDEEEEETTEDKNEDVIHKDMNKMKQKLIEITLTR